MFLLQVEVSLGRIERFLKDDELDSCVEREENADRAIEMRDAALSWQPQERIKPTLRGINLDVKKGGHVAVCGAVGSGKSTLLYSILGEIPKVSGRVSGSIISLNPQNLQHSLMNRVNKDRTINQETEFWM